MQIDIVWAFNAPPFWCELTGSGRDAEMLLVSFTGVHHRAPRRGLGWFFVCTRLKHCKPLSHRQGWGNIPVLRKGNSISSPFAQTKDAEGKWWDVASQGWGSRCTATSLPLVHFRNALLPRPLPSSRVALLRLLPGHIPGLRGTEGHKSHANSEVLIFSKKPTSSLLKLVPGNLPEGPHT